MAYILSISLPSKDSVRGFSTGIPPPTDASNLKLTLFSLAILTSLSPYSANISLFAVTTFILSFKALFIYS